MADCLRHQILQPLSGLALAQPDQRAIAQLADTLAGHSHHPADFLERPALTVFNSEIEPQHLGIARGERSQSRLDVLRLAVGHRPRDRKSTRLNSSNVS